MADKFFVNPSSSRKRTLRQSGNSANGAASKRPERAGTVRDDNDEDITSESEDGGIELGDEASESESDHETETDKRRRLAKEYLSSLETDLVEGFDAKDLDEDIIARRLRHDAAEQKGHIFRDLSNAEISQLRKTRLPMSKNLSCIASYGLNVYVGAKDGSLTKLRLKNSVSESGLECVKAHEQQRIVCETPQLDRPATSAVIAIAANNKLVAVGFHAGFAVYNAESLELMREFRIYGSVLSLVFRKGTSELYVGGSDLRLRTYDLSQWAFVETLHGHQDEIVGLSALSMERCVSVGARDRTAIFWKIPEESRLTFRGGDTKLAAKIEASERRNQESNAKEENTENTTANGSSSTTNGSNENENKQERIDRFSVTLEGSIDCCAMLDHQFFVTGSDNGNLSLWSTNRKKPLQILATAHGMHDKLTPAEASGETYPDRVEIPPQLPHSISSVAAVPFSNTFFTGSDSGTLSVWSLDEEKKGFNKTRDIEIGQGVVTGISVSELDNDEFAVCVSLSREPRLGRWLVRSGRDQVVSLRLK